MQLGLNQNRLAVLKVAISQEETAE